MNALIWRVIVAAAVSCGAFVYVAAQPIHYSRDLFKARMSRVKATVVDSLTNEPIAFASVYLIPENDTTISNFTLSGDNGEARLEEIPFGGYSFRVEIMGYRPHYTRRAEQLLLVQQRQPLFQPQLQSGSRIRMGSGQQHQYGCRRQLQNGIWTPPAHRRQVEFR